MSDSPHIKEQVVRGVSSLALHGALSIAILAILGAAIFFGAKFYQELKQETHANASQLELLNKNVLNQNQQTVLLRVIDTNIKRKVGDKLEAISIEDKVRLASTVYSLAAIRRIPLSLVCAVIEHESRWIVNAVNPESGATGLMQEIPVYAKPYLRSERLPDTADSLKDPAINAMVGISMLSDNQSYWLEREKTVAGDFTLALHSYAWGPAATWQLLGKKDQRVNVPNLAYPTAMIALRKKYQDLGLE